MHDPVLGDTGVFDKFSHPAYAAPNNSIMLSTQVPAAPDGAGGNGEAGAIVLKAVKSGAVAQL